MNAKWTRVASRIDAKHIVANILDEGGDESGQVCVMDAPEHCSHQGGFSLVKIVETHEDGRVVVEPVGPSFRCRSLPEAKRQFSAHLNSMAIRSGVDARIDRMREQIDAKRRAAVKKSFLSGHDVEILEFRSDGSKVVRIRREDGRNLSGDELRQYRDGWGVGCTKLYGNRGGWMFMVAAAI